MENQQEPCLKTGCTDVAVVGSNYCTYHQMAMMAKSKETISGAISKDKIHLTDSAKGTA